ncbi:hypothetical protein [Bifidobacterium goeldii]|uniref:hypothetical protein n=1 Tax=Bifidobacterium goeldii TaxID=2306975 RepID=UPI001F49DD15|nr:hypothetical protein [Bifidobacterium goeldii]
MPTNGQPSAQPNAQPSGNPPIIERAGDPLAAQAAMYNNANNANAQGPNAPTANNNQNGTSVSGAVNEVVGRVAPVVNDVVGHVTPVVKAAGRQAANGMKKLDPKSRVAVIIMACVLAVMLIGGIAHIHASHAPASDVTASSQSTSSQMTSTPQPTETPQQSEASKSESSDSTDTQDQSSSSSASQPSYDDFASLWRSEVQGVDMTKLAGTYCRNDGTCIKLEANPGYDPTSENPGSLSLVKGDSSPLPDGDSKSELGFAYQSAQDMPDVKTPISMIAGCQGSAGCETEQFQVYYLMAGTGLDFFSQQYYSIPVDSANLPDANRDYLVVGTTDGPTISADTVFYRKRSL